jgi:hypothetical protein
VNGTSQGERTLRYARFMILPNRSNALSGVILGCAAAAAGIYFQLALFSFLLIGLGLFVATLSVFSFRERAPLPRIEIDNKGIRDVWFFGARSIDWTAIAWLEPIAKSRGDSIDHCVRIILGTSNPPKSADPPDHYDLTLDNFLPSEHRDLDATAWIGDWLEEFRKNAVMHPNALAQLRHPRYLEGRFV